jgi:hypothetical protein
LKQSSRNSVLKALTGVLGEAIDLEVAGLLMCSGVMSTDLGEGANVVKEETDSELDEIESC